MVDDEISTKWHALDFLVERSIRYHMRREGFFDFASRVVLFIATLLGSATFLALVNENQFWAQAAALTVTLASAFDLVFGFNGKARQHYELRKRFVRLQQRMLCDPDAKALEEMTRERLDIEADEPPIFRALDLLAHNEVMRSRGYDERDPANAPHFHHLPWYRRAFANVFRQEGVADALKVGDVGA